jgi:hypothetical protein
MPIFSNQITLSPDFIGGVR